MLEAGFGAGQVPATMTSAAAPGVTRRWKRIGDYVEEVANARIWGGIHYRSSANVGQVMGRKIGEFAVPTCARLEPRARAAAFCQPMVGRLDIRNGPIRMDELPQPAAGSLNVTSIPSSETAVKKVSTGPQ